MRARHDRLLGGRDVAFVDGPVFLVGLFCLASPWIVHYANTQLDLRFNNLLVGAAIALMGLGFTVIPQRMHGLSWAMCAMGVWLVIAPWIVIPAGNPDAGIIWTNAVVGGLTFLLGIACAFTAARKGGTTRA